MEVQVLLCIDVDMDKMPDNVKEACKANDVSKEGLEDLIKAAMRGTVSNILKEKWNEESAFKLVFATTDCDPRIEDSLRCTVSLVSDGTYILQGDAVICEDLKQTIGDAARVLPGG